MSSVLPAAAHTQGKQNRWIKHHRLACLHFAVLAAIASCALFGGNRPPVASVNLLAEDFGCGISLLQAADEARQAAALPSNEYWVLDPEELLDRNPFAERPAGDSLVVAVVSDVSFEQNGRSIGLGPVVSRVMLFPAADNETITLAGTPLASYSPEAFAAVLGVEGSVTDGRDGNLHSTFQFTLDSQRNLVGALTSSHDSRGRCFALELRVEADPASLL